MNFIKVIIIVIMLFLLHCGRDKPIKQVEIEPEKYVQSQIPVKCISLLAYWLLSNDECDIPFGGACKDIASDSLVSFLQLQKHIFKNSEQNEKIDAKELIRQIEENTKISMGCQISEDCITLLTYGLLSEEEFDIPIEGVCKSIISDSLVKYLQLQKHVFKRWQRNELIVDTSAFVSSWKAESDIRLLRELILTRIFLGPGFGKNSQVWLLMNAKAIEKGLDIEDLGADIADLWFKNASDINVMYGGEFSFVWRFYMLGFIHYHRGPTINMNTLTRISSFNDYVAYLDSSLIDISSWCEDVDDFAQELRKYSENDFLMRYYDIRCQKE